MKQLAKPWVLIAVISVVVVSGLLLSIPLRFLGAEKKLTQESSNLKLATSFTQTRSEYIHGYCFDNCPVLVQAFEVSGDRTDLSNQLSDRLSGNGYEVEVNRNGDVVAYKGDDITVDANFLPAVSYKRNSLTGLPVEDPAPTTLEVSIYNQ